MLTETSGFHTCCRRLAEALGRPAAEGAGEAFLVVEGEGGALFYKVGHAFGGQFTSAFGERVAFCPFCGREVGAGGGGRAPDGPEAEDTSWQLGETQEVETVVAARAARAAGGFA